MYFSLPSSRQVTSGFFGSSPPLVRRSLRTLARSPQSSSANCFWMSAVTPPLGSAGADGLGVVVAVGLGVEAARSASGTARPLVDALGAGDAAGALPDADGEGEAVPDGDGLGAGSAATPPAAFRTGRKRSSAVCCTVARIELSRAPGTEMTMFWPAVVTSASATPKLSTRDLMISTARSRACLVILPVSPGATRGVRMMLVPPSRSNPSRGLYFSWSVRVSSPSLSGATK